MKVGLYLMTQFTPETDCSAARVELLEQVRAARKSGFASVWVPHHYLTHPMQMLQPMPLLGYILHEAEGMVIGPNILIGPLLNPVHVAEEALTLDLLSDGNYVLGIGIGYREAEFETFGVPLKERVPRMNDAVAIMRALWKGGKVEYEGRVHSVRDLGAGLPSTRPGGIPIWMAAVVESAVKRAARIGDAWLITNFAHLRELVPLMQVYRASLAEHGKPFPADAPITRECYIGPSRAAALEECRAALEYKYAAYSSWGLDTQSEGAESFKQPFEEFARDRFIIGDKAFVKDEVQRYNELLGVNHFIMRVQWPGIANAQALRTIDALGETFS